jgi:hypothetical protein
VTEVEEENVEDLEVEIGVVLEMAAEEEETEVSELHLCTRLHVMAVAR